MNQADIAVIAIIGGFGIIGLIRGFIYSIFKIGSFFASAFIAVKFYSKVADFLSKTAVYTAIKDSIFKSLMRQKDVFIPASGQLGQANAGDVIKNLRIPGFLKEMFEDKISNLAGLLDPSKIMDAISSNLAGVVISVASLILLFIAARIVLALLGFVFKGIAKMPVFKQMDKVGGFIFGALEGFLTVYVICAVLTFFNAAPQFKAVFDAIESSTLAKFFYQNNFIMQWMFPPRKPTI
jgi:uncharacterized membrane protein required for colicin V production